MHFLKKSEVHARTLGKPRACVNVKVEGRDRLVVCGGDDGKHGVFVAKIDSQWSELPERIKVVGPDGKVIKPSKGKQFYVSTETFDPFHALLEAGDSDWY